MKTSKETVAKYLRFLQRIYDERNHKQIDIYQMSVDFKITRSIKSHLVKLKIIDSNSNWILPVAPNENIAETVLEFISKYNVQYNLEHKKNGKRNVYKEINILYEIREIYSVLNNTPLIKIIKQYKLQDNFDKALLELRIIKLFDGKGYKWIGKSPDKDMVTQIKNYCKQISLGIPEFKTEEEYDVATIKRTLRLVAEFVDPLSSKIEIVDNKIDELLNIWK